MRVCVSAFFFKNVTCHLSHVKITISIMVEEEVEEERCA